MKRVAHHAFTSLCVLSLLLCVAVCVLWVTSYAGGNAVTRLTKQGRLTVRSERGTLSLTRPPRASDPLAQKLARNDFSGSMVELRVRSTGEWLVNRIRNDQTSWFGTRVVSGPEQGRWRSLVVFPTDDVGELWPPHSARYTAGDYIPALVAALEQPDKFAVAHLLLGINLEEMEPLTEPRRAIHQQSAESVRYTCDGLTFDVRAIGEGDRYATHLADDEEVVDAASSIDVRQLPAIRDLWHRRLDVPVVAVPHWALVAVLLVAPGWRGAAFVYRRCRGRVLVKAGRCPSCGYDLRATPGRCPECGTAPPSAGIA
jgi:hypothetical protein